MLLANLSRQKRINLGLVTFSVLLLFFHNCGNVSISQGPALGSQGGGGDYGSNNNNPPAPTPTKVTDLYFCESYLVQGQLRYYVHPFNLFNSSFGAKIETGNCMGHITADINNDARDEFIHNYTNSTVHSCKLEVYNTQTTQISFSQNLPGQLNYTDNNLSICSGQSWAVSDQNNDGKNDLYYYYRNAPHSQPNSREQVIVLDASTGQEITSMTAPHSGQANLYTLADDINRDGLQDFIGFVPGVSTQNEIRDVKIAFYDAKQIWGLPLRTHNLPVHHHMYQARLLKNKSGPSKYLISTLRMALNGQGVYTTAEVSMGIYDSNLNKSQTYSRPNFVSGNLNYSMVIESVGDFTGDGLDDVVALQNNSQSTFKSMILDGSNLNLIQEFSGAWISQKLGRPVSDFFRVIGFAQADSDAALELFLLVWETNKISVIAIKNNGQVVIDKTSPSEWLSEIFQIRSPL